MKRNLWLSLPLAVSLMAGCGSDEDPKDTPDSGVVNADAGGGGDPDFPTVGTQLDRMGRAAISTALVATIADEPAKGTAKDSYNAAGPTGWPAFADALKPMLGVYDALDAQCGNQLLAGVGSSTNSPDTYTVLAGALADDRLWVNSAASTCTTYFAVELAATGVAPALSTDCGGRTPQYDVIDVSYSALAAGALMGVSDGVAMDDATHPSTFPYLAAP